MEIGASEAAAQNALSVSVCFCHPLFLSFFLYLTLSLTHTTKQARVKRRLEMPHLGQTVEIRRFSSRNLESQIVSLSGMWGLPEPSRSSCLPGASEAAIGDAGPGSRVVPDGDRVHDLPHLPRHVEQPHPRVLPLSLALALALARSLSLSLSRSLSRALSLSLSLSLSRTCTGVRGRATETGSRSGRSGARRVSTSSTASRSLVSTSSPVRRSEGGGGSRASSQSITHLAFGAFLQRGERVC